jgi:hypothetical protein
VHPLSTALFLLGYALAVPIVSRLPGIIARQQRLAMWGHQLGVLLAASGWLLRGQVAVALIHGVWLVVAYSLFEVLGSRAARASGRA